MKLYLDTSALVSLYYPESCSDRVAAFVAGFPLPFSPLHELETKNALMLKVFRGEADLKAVRDKLRSAGNPAKVAITAPMRKLIELPNTPIKADRLWVQKSSLIRMDTLKGTSLGQNRMQFSWVDIGAQFCADVGVAHGA